MISTNRIVINSRALGNNLKRINYLTNNIPIMAILKNNAYGHGIEFIARYLEKDIDSIGLSRIEEVLILREKGFKKPIVLLTGIHSAEVLELCIFKQVSLVVISLIQIDLINNSGLTKPIEIWIKIDTGMHRLGIQPEEVSDCYRMLKKNKYISRINWMTHFACADHADNQHVINQNNLFCKVTKNLPGLKSAANSAAIIQYHSSHYDTVRPGLILYGVSPIIGLSASSIGLVPVMTLKSYIIAIKQVKKGRTVGYGATWSPVKDSIIAVVAFGYGDGYPQFAPNGTPILLNGVRVPIVGRVSMDLLSVDITVLDGVRIGDEVTLWGEGLPVEEIAAHTQQSSYSLLSGISERVKREML